ncbi:MAG TPA: helix-turn-helix domain-containing protein [Steroidobacteraceae bacterium]|jgi:excisionase family DNA binding protein
MSSGHHFTGAAMSSRKTAQRVSLPPLDVNQRYNISEAADYLRCCRVTLYKLIGAKKIRTMTVGKRRYVPGSEIVRLSR